MKIKYAFAMAAGFLTAAQSLLAATINLTPLNVLLNVPVGLGYSPVSSSLMEKHRWVDPRTIRPYLHEGFPGGRVPGSKDVQWLRAHTAQLYTDK